LSDAAGGLVKPRAGPGAAGPIALRLLAKGAAGNVGQAV